MKNATTPLINFLLNQQTRVFCNLYTVTLRGGGVLYWTDAAQAITYNSITYALGPKIEDHGINQKVGVQTDSLSLKMFYSTADTISGAPIASFVMGLGFDGAVFRVDRAWADSWASMFGNNIVGTFCRFMGRFSEAQDVGETECTLIINSPEELLDTNVPTDLWSSSCLNTFCDANCTLSAASYTTSGTVSSVTSAQAFKINLTPTAGIYNFGYLTFTSGANAGVQRSIQSQDASGNLSFIAPFPSTPAVSDAFTITQGCDLQLNTCVNNFSNKAHFRGQPFVPLPVSVTGAPQASVDGQSALPTTGTGAGGGTISAIPGIARSPGNLH